MRRRDREIKEFDEIVKIIKKCDSLVLGLNDEGYPYLVPLNFGMDIEDGQLYLYFHCAKEGKKLDLIQKDNRASFEMDHAHQLVLNDEKMSCTMGYESVTGKGFIEIVSEDKKIKGLKILMKHYHVSEFPFSLKPVKNTTVFRLKVIELKGKRRKVSVK